MSKPKGRRESITSAYKKTTKFLTENKNLIMKRMPHVKKYRHDLRSGKFVNNVYQKVEYRDASDDSSSEESDFGERDLDYYLGVRTNETYWRDPEREEQLRKDDLINHCGVSEEDYNDHYKRTVKKHKLKTTKLKQVPFRIYKKKRSLFQKDDLSLWSDNILKIFIGNKRLSESTSNSYSDYESPDAKDNTNQSIDFELHENFEVKFIYIPISFVTVYNF